MSLRLADIRLHYNPENTNIFSNFLQTGQAQTVIAINTVKESMK